LRLDQTRHYAFAKAIKRRAQISHALRLNNNIVGEFFRKESLFDFGFFKINMPADYGVVFFQNEFFRNISGIFLCDVEIPCSFGANQSDFLYCGFSHFSSSKDLRELKL
jgi:hypothetical protein